MKSNKLIPGVTLILIGAVILLSNYNVIHVRWGNLIYLWPLFIVVAGINLIFANNKAGWATALKLGVIVIGFGMVVFGDFDRKYTRWGDNLNFQFDDDDDNDRGSDYKVHGSKSFTEPYNDSIKVAELNISGGGTVYRLSDTTSQLLTAETGVYGNSFNNYLTRSNTDSLTVLTYKMKNNNKGSFKWRSKGNNSNTATFKLNPNPIWSLKIETGASKVDFDLSKFKIKKLDLEGGAASVDVKLGQPLETTNIEVSTGASEVTINVPATAAVHISKNTGLSSSDFDGFTKKADNNYETAGFAAAKNKMYININGGVSDFKVKRY